MRAMILPPALCLLASCATVGFTPEGVCARSGLAQGSQEYRDCVSRTYRERRAEFNRTQGNDLAVGAVVAGAVAATAQGAPAPYPGQRSVPLASQTLVGTQRQCRYVTPSGQVTVVVQGLCPSSYAY